MSQNFDPVGGILSDIVTAVFALLLSIIVDPLNALLAPFLGENVIDLND